MAGSTAATNTAAATKADLPRSARAGVEGNAPIPESFWRSLRHLNAFRLLLACFFVVLSLLAGPLQLLPARGLDSFFYISLAYGVTVWGFGLMLRDRRPQFGRQVFIQVVLDIVVLSMLMHLAGGNRTGLGLLLIVPLSAAGLHPGRRTMFFLSALATLAVLGEQTVGVLSGRSVVDGYARAGMLSMGLFLVALLSYLLARGTLASTRLAWEKALQAERLTRVNAQVIRDLPYGVVVVDELGRVLLFNAQARTLLGRDLPPLTELAACQPALAVVWEDWRAGGNLHHLPTTLDDAGLRLRVRLKAMDETRDEGALLIIEDLSELEQAAQRLKLAALGRLTANLAHEIRNPLSAIGHAAQLLSEDNRQDAATVKLTRIIGDNVSRLNWLVEDVLSLSRRDRLNREPVDLEPFLADFVTHFQQAERVPEGVISMTLMPGACLLFDRLHLHQILWNLCRNAWRFCTRRPGGIALQVSVTGGETRLEIHNDGPPITSEMQQRLFEPFFTTDRRGTGLGLYISRELAEANEARLQYVNRDDGACFRLAGQSCEKVS